MELPNVIEITKGEDVSPMDIDGESKSGVDNGEDGKKCNGKSYHHFIGAVCLLVPLYHISYVYRRKKALSLHQSALELIKILAPNMELTVETMRSKPLILLAYDEAHGLNIPINNVPTAPTALSQH